MFITEKHVELVKLRMERRSWPEIAIALNEPVQRIRDWAKSLKRSANIELPAIGMHTRIVFTLPCEICGLTISTKVLTKRIRCRKHRHPIIWLDADTPAWKTKAERARYWYYHGGKESRMRSAMAWTKKKMATDPVWKKKFQEYQNAYNRRKRVARAQSEGASDAS